MKYNISIVGIRCLSTSRDFFNSLSVPDCFSLCKQYRLKPKYKKFPPNITDLEGNSFYIGIANEPTKTSFFYLVDLFCIDWHKKAEPINCDRAQVHRLCVLASGTNYCHLHKFEINEIFLLTFWTKQRKIF